MRTPKWAPSLFTVCCKPNPETGRQSTEGAGVGDGSPMLISPTSAPSVDCCPLSRLRLQYEQRWRPFWSLHAIVAILRKIEDCKQSTMLVQNPKQVSLLADLQAK